MHPSFGVLLATYRERVQRSRNGLALEVGVDPSYLTRIEHEEREPPRRDIVLALARGLRLTPFERNQLLVEAGHAPVVAWSPTLQSVVDVLEDWSLSEAERAEFASVVASVARRWRR